MRIACPNCKAVHEITHRDDNTIIRCTNCGKNIKFQNCPHCNTFYSITFSKIKLGNYTYKCKRCNNNFTVKISNDEKIVQERKIVYNNEQSISTEPIKKQIINKNKVSGTSKYRSMETFTISELFKSTSEAFTIKKLIVSAIGITSILILLQIFNSIMNLVPISVFNSRAAFINPIMNLLPIAVIFSFYILTASIVSKITLNHMFHLSTETGEIINFTVKRGPGIIGVNIILLLAVSLLLLLFGNIPFLGPILFSLLFLPIYLISAAILILSFIGVWFYPTIAAHDDRGVFKNVKSLLLFIKEHNLNIIFMIPIIFLITAGTFAVISIVHITVFSFTTSLSQLFIGEDVLMTFSSIPSQLIKSSQTIFMGINSSVFKELYQSLGVTHHIAGFMLGIIFLIITVFILSIPISVAATVSTHIYVLMERKRSIDDKTKALVLSILIMLIVLIILINKII